MWFRGRLLAALALLVELAGVTLLPALHLAHHQHGGHDHVHRADGGTDWIPALIEEPPQLSADEHHHAFDADLEALGLSDVMHAGVAAVDCSLAEYTLVDCGAGLADGAGAVPATASHGFGDELLARLPHRHPHPITNPFHGEGSLEHFGLAVLATPVFLLPPPHQPLALAPRARPEVQRAADPPHDAFWARGPPPFAA